MLQKLTHQHWPPHASVIEAPHSCSRTLGIEGKHALAWLSIKSVLVRYTVTGVFSNCKFQAQGCCADPVVYQRINDEIKTWIRKFAPGVRDSDGCPKKKGELMKTTLYLCYD